MTQELLGLEFQSVPKLSVLCAEVAVPVPVEGLFSYSIPEDLRRSVMPGIRVRVPFKNREITAYVARLGHSAPNMRLKPILKVLDDAPVLSDSMLALTRWVSEYYGSSWGEAIENALPRWVKHGRESSGKKASTRGGSVAPLTAVAEEVTAPLDPADPLKLTPSQDKAWSVIELRLGEKHPKPVLLFGVTGSGKSELYIRAIAEVLKKKRGAICLVPEIALTEQLRHFFYVHFGDHLEVLHSRLSDAERFLAWKRLEKGERRVVLGPRSAVFAPIADLGLIVMDEEHEGSYKQETTPRYHAREVAFERARAENALFIMGSATPSLESMHQSLRGESERLDLPVRVDDRPMPEVRIVDLKQEGGIQKKRVILGSQLVREIENNLTRKEGTLLLLNRRGFSTHIHCPKCGRIESCASCQVPLIFHQEEDRLICHYCNAQKKTDDVCPDCRLPVMRFGGFGTEKVESEVAAFFPAARIARMDADSVRKKGSHERILKSFRDRSIDILIGTQMIAKGFDFPHVTLVGVILADVGLMLPDFRSSERTFQLLTQVAGRAGRGLVPGRVILQTFSPEHPSVAFAREHDYKRFLDWELRQRRDYGYPPFMRLANIIVRSRDEKSAYAFARTLRDGIREILGLPDKPHPSAENPASPDPGLKTELVGPSPLPFYKLRGHYRWHVMLKLPPASGDAARLRDFLVRVKKPAGVAFALDVDPLNIL